MRKRVRNDARIEELADIMLAGIRRGRAKHRHPVAACEDVHCWNHTPGGKHRKDDVA